MRGRLGVPEVFKDCEFGTDLVDSNSCEFPAELILNFLSKLRFSADQSPEPGDAVVAHVLDLALGRPRLQLAYCNDAGDWSNADTGEALLTKGARRMVMGWVPSDDDQERKYRDRFGR